MKYFPLPLQLLSALLALQLNATAQLAPADDFFHAGAQLYISNNIPKALEVVTNALVQYPNDVKLKKLEELLKQQQQQQKDQQKQEQQKQEQQKQDQQQQNQKQQQDQQKDQQQQQQQSSQDKQEQRESEKKDQQPDKAKMTPEEAKRLLDGQKGEERLLQFKPDEKPKNRLRVIKDW